MERNLRKERIGVVVSNKMEKTIVVAVARKVKHPIYVIYLFFSAYTISIEEKATICNK